MKLESTVWFDMCDLAYYNSVLILAISIVEFT